MADHSSIEWTDATWNPITGCSIVSPGCTNCYAMKLAGTRLRHIPSREGLTKDTKAGPVWTGEVRLNEQWLDQPQKWKRPRKIFVCAHGDLFAENVPDEWIDRVFAIMAQSPQHTFQVLTKRAERMRAYLTPKHDFDFAERLMRGMRQSAPHYKPWTIQVADWAIHPGHPGNDMPLSRDPHILAARANARTFPLPNVWLGVSAERQQEADERIPHLLATPAALRFVSAEPLLGPLDFRRIKMQGVITPLDALRGEGYTDITIGQYAGQRIFHGVKYGCGRGLDWIIVGGESGQGARPMHPDWARSIRDQCAAAGVAFHFKQWGAWGLDDGPPARGRDRVMDGEVRCAVWNGTGWDHRRNGYEPEIAPGIDMEWMFHIGKKRAGRLLDGVEHNGFPS